MGVTTYDNMHLRVSCADLSKCVPWDELLFNGWIVLFVIMGLMSTRASLMMRGLVIVGRIPMALN